MKCVLLLFLVACAPSAPLTTECAVPVTHDSSNTCIWSVPPGVPCADIRVTVDGEFVDADVICGSGQFVLSSAACSAARAGGVVEVVVPCGATP